VNVTNQAAAVKNLGAYCVRNVQAGRAAFGVLALFKQRRMALIADAVSAKIYVRRAGHTSDVLADNGNRAKLLQ
jgi:hypothetical protein